MAEKRKTGFEELAKTSIYTQEQLMKVKKGKHSFFIGLPHVAMKCG
jgi:alanine dehydrogenase